MSVKPRIAVESIPGKRPYQEDSVIAEVLEGGRTLMAVADGMGGHAAGEVASALALRTLQEALAEGKDLGGAFRLANQRVHRMAGEPGKQGMGTTMVAVLVTGEEFLVANVGDSRAYVISATGIKQLTEDHSFVAEAMKGGQSREQAMATPWRDALTRSIGSDPQVEVDVFGPYPLPGNSAFVICSDGLYKTLTDDDLRELFVRSGGPGGAAQAMVTSAFDGGSDDNISVAIAEFGDVPRAAARSPLVSAYDAAGSDLGDDPGAGRSPQEAVSAESVEPEPGPPPAASGGAESVRALITGLSVAALAVGAAALGSLVALLVFSRSASAPR